MQRPCQAFPMTAGDDLANYAHNSSHQKEGWQLVKPKIEKAIHEKFKIDEFPSTKTFNVTDLGCSTGPNTFLSMQTILDAMVQKCQLSEDKSYTHEFQVFFNDHCSNDFNSLFTSLPSDRRYFAAGVPGSFHGRLFPKASLHFVNSSYSLHWLSEVPKEVMDMNSPAWNRGRIHYVGGPKEVVEAYKKQYTRDVEVFLSARAEEMVCGGLMALLLVGEEEEIEPIDTGRILEMALVEMASEGLIDEAQIDSFNLPIYCPTAEEFKNVVDKNGYFSIETLEVLCSPSECNEVIDSKAIAKHIRAFTESLICKHFGNEVMDEIYMRFENKVKENAHLLKSTNVALPALFVLLKRKNDHQLA